MKNKIAAVQKALNSKDGNIIIDYLIELSGVFNPDFTTLDPVGLAKQSGINTFVLSLLKLKYKNFEAISKLIEKTYEQEWRENAWDNS